MRKAFAYAGVDEDFTSEQFDREWEKSAAKSGDKYQLMEKLDIHTNAELVHFALKHGIADI